MLLVPPSVTHAAKPSTTEAKTPPPPIEMTIEGFFDPFDRNVFESVVDKVIIGESLDDGNSNPYKLTFIYKTGFTSSVQGVCQ